jgi:hypothetical protein
VGCGLTIDNVGQFTEEIDDIPIRSHTSVQRFQNGFSTRRTSLSTITISDNLSSVPVRLRQKVTTHSIPPGEVRFRSDNILGSHSHSILNLGLVGYKVSKFTKPDAKVNTRPRMTHQ